MWILSTKIQRKEPIISCYFRRALSVSTSCQPPENNAPQVSKCQLYKGRLCWLVLFSHTQRWYTCTSFFFFTIYLFIFCFYVMLFLYFFCYYKFLQNWIIISIIVIYLYYLFIYFCFSHSVMFWAVPQCSGSYWRPTKESWSILTSYHLDQCQETK